MDSFHCDLKETLTRGFCFGFFFFLTVTILYAYFWATKLKKLFTCKIETLHSLNNPRSPYSALTTAIPLSLSNCFATVLGSF